MPTSASRCSHFARTAGSVAGNDHVVEQRLDVQHRPAHQHRNPPPGRDRLDVGGGGLLVTRDSRGLGDVEDVELMMRDAVTLCDGQFCGADVHAAVELHRVGVDDFRAGLSAEPLRDVKGQLRFAGTGRPDDRQWPHGCQTPAKYPTPYGSER